MATPTKKSDNLSSPCRSSSRRRVSENVNPNLNQSPRVRSSLKSSNSPSLSANKQKQIPSSTSIPTRFLFTSQKESERKFLIAKKTGRKPTTSAVAAAAAACSCKDRDGSQKCRCIAYQDLRASQEEFFKNNPRIEDNFVVDSVEQKARIGEATKPEINDSISSKEIPVSPNAALRHQVLQEALESLPESGSGRVLHLVKAFESLLFFPKHHESDGEANNVKVMKWALPGMQMQPPVVAQVTTSPTCSFSNSETFKEMFSKVSESFASSSRESLGSSTVSSGNGSRKRNSSDMCGRGDRRRQQNRITRQQPFRLRTEQRGRQKQEEFHKKIEQMFVEEATMRIPVAQGLPWTTDEPQCLVKPPVKDNTKPMDLKLHSDIRAMERAEFDHAVAEKMSLMEQHRLEEERLQKLAEEEEIRRLRKELVPRAQPMPYFDRPFIPKRSMKPATLPRDPRLFHHVPQQKTQQEYNKKQKVLSF